MYDHMTAQPTIQGATFSMRGQLYHGTILWLILYTDTEKLQMKIH